MSHRTRPELTEKMPSGIPHIIGNEAAERFSFYGMKAILVVFLTQYLHLMDGAGEKAMDETRATELVHIFNGIFYLTPIIGALAADIFFGKYKVIIVLSIVYCLGHAALAIMGYLGNAEHWMVVGLCLIALGAGGIKPCVSAHVGDQFGVKNHSLLPRVFNWFYFSINLGALASMLLTPWLLKWYGPHWAFGVPGVLMAIATIVFWLGRKQFAHIPAGGKKFVKEAFSWIGISTLLKLIPVYLFVAIFWALFDQTGSTWIFQAQNMDREFLGIEWLPSQIQSLNSVFILSFIPIFSYVIYPTAHKVFLLHPLRKMGIGFVLMAAAFVVVSLVQEKIDAGGRPNISWQILAYALLTASEVMISIVALEFAYTQAPRKMKSLVMCYFLAAVAIGNFLVAGVNHLIRIPSAAALQLAEAIENLPKDWQDSPRSVILPGYDKSDPEEFFVCRLGGEGDLELEVPGQVTIDQATAAIGKYTQENQKLPNADLGNSLIAPFKDYWGNAYRFQTESSTQAIIISSGADREPGTKWDIGATLEFTKETRKGEPSWFSQFQPDFPWLERHKSESVKSASDEDTFSADTFSGGQVRLKGADYFWFFSILMGVTALLFIPFAMIYRPKSYLQD